MLLLVQQNIRGHGVMTLMTTGTHVTSQCCLMDSGGDEHGTDTVLLHWKKEYHYNPGPTGEVSRRGMDGGCRWLSLSCIQMSSEIHVFC